MSAVLFINDNNLLLQQGGQISRSQGYAWLKDGDVFFDFVEEHNAVAACRLNPQQINSRYWQQCQTTSLPENNSGMRHAADLIWKHLSEIAQRHQIQELLLVVPSHYQTSNLELLLGIAKACGLSVSAIVNKAVLAVSQQAHAKNKVLHIDVQLHQTVCSEVVNDGSECRLGKTEVLHEVGLQKAQDALLKAAQERFIQSDRFDPLHYAETEQQLFDQLPKIANEIQQQGKAALSVVYEHRQYTASIDARQWAAALASMTQALNTAKVEFTPEQRLYDLNAFSGLRFQDDERAMVHQANSPVDASALLAKVPPAQGLVYMTALSVVRSPKPNVEPSAELAAQTVANAGLATQASSLEGAQEQPVSASEAKEATHILFNGRAIALSNAHIDIVQNDFSLSVAQASNIASLLAAKTLFILGDQDRVSLKINDRLGSAVCDSVLTVIRVE